MASMEAALKKLDQMGIVDPKRVGGSGLSYGADIVQYSISHSDLFQTAIISGGGGLDPCFYYMAGSAWHKAWASRGLGGWPEEPKQSARWHELSPALNAQHVKAPVLINASESEYLVSLQFYTSLQELANPVEMFILCRRSSHEKPAKTQI